MYQSGVHKVGGLIKALPPIWGLKDRVRGRGVGEHKAQFIFQCKRDIQQVLSKGPWFVNGWMVAMDRWSPNPGQDFLNVIPFWIRMKGIPIHCVKKSAVESLISPLGRVDAIELHAKNSDFLEYVRAHAWIKVDEPLQFRKLARFRSGETALTDLVYEKLLMVCFACKRLTHDQDKCPYQIKEQEQYQRRSEGEGYKERKEAPTKGKGKEKRSQMVERLEDPGTSSRKNLKRMTNSKRGSVRKSAKERL